MTDETTDLDEIGAGEYRKFVYARLTSVKDVKASLRTLCRDSVMVRVAHALTGIGSEVPEVIDVVGGWLIGAEQIGSIDQEALRLELGDVLYYTTGACRLLKVDMPSMKKRIHLEGNAQRAVLALSNQAADLVDFVKKGAFKGTEIDVEAVQAAVAVFAYTLWGVIEALTHKKVNVIATMNRAKLEKRDVDSFIAQESAQNA